MSEWRSRVLQYIVHLRSLGQPCPPHVGGNPSLYGETYTALTYYYLTGTLPPGFDADAVLIWQDPRSGRFVGPELASWNPPKGTKFDRVHLETHQTISVLPLLALCNVKPRYPLVFAQQYLRPRFLAAWLDQRDWREAWNEGNKLLFVLQLLAYLRDNENLAGAQERLDQVFAWLDAQVDPMTGLWGTNGFVDSFRAMCGAYHQLLAYYHEERPIRFPERVVDSVLDLQCFDGGFVPSGGGGACEDVDAVDILVNSYERSTYRRAHIKIALKHCLRHLLKLQNRDGGFPYNRHVCFSHMQIPATRCAPGTSNAFSTWFRVHAIALIAQVLKDDTRVSSERLHFNCSLSMGWHRSPSGNGVQHTAPEDSWECMFRLARTSRFWRTRSRRLLKQPARLVRALASRCRTIAARA